MTRDRFAIEVYELSKVYGTAGATPAVDKVSLKIGEGERIGIVGRNGAGKSTLLHMIAGLSEPTSGTLRVTGKVTSVMTLGVGLREQLTGRENIYVDGEIQGKSRREVDCFLDRVIDFAELGDFIDMPVRTYSTGMKARLGFAMITTIEPEILVIDEALSAGDAHFAKKADGAIRRLCELGRIVIMVSHSMRAIRDMSTRCLWMDAGKLVMDGDSDTVTSAYVDAVRRDDEVKLLERFRKRMQSTHVRGNGFDRLDIAYADSEEPSTAVKAGADVAVRIGAAPGPGVSRAVVELRITRLDGLVAFQELAEGPVKEDGRVDLRVLLRPMVFAPGSYIVAAKLISGKTLAARSTIMEVFADELPRGGRPALLYPVQMTVHGVDGIEHARI
ncbi:MAG TPA: ABC transporter ATP-binding protein [Burkholderiales bacterium]|nr:ABC transporter ATP-binding protein [Burkholderiales bacterium]